MRLTVNHDCGGIGTGGNYIQTCSGRSVRLETDNLARRKGIGGSEIPLDDSEGVVGEIHFGLIGGKGGSRGVGDKLDCDFTCRKTFFQGGGANLDIIYKDKDGGGGFNLQSG